MLLGSDAKVYFNPAIVTLDHIDPNVTALYFSCLSKWRDDIKVEFSSDLVFSSVPPVEELR